MNNEIRIRKMPIDGGLKMYYWINLIDGKKIQLTIPIPTKENECIDDNVVFDYFSHKLGEYFANLFTLSIESNYTSPS